MPKKYAKKRVKKTKKVNTFAKNFRMGDYHQNSLANYNHSYQPSTTLRYLSNELTLINKGDLLNNRQTNLIYVNNLQYVETLRNTANTTRTLRLMLVALRGSTSSADTVNWGDLLINYQFTKQGLQGEDFDSILRINQDEYEKIYDKTFKINGASSGENPARIINVNIPIKKYVSYAYNSTIARKNSLYLISVVNESAGIAPSATLVNSERRWTMHYHDVIRSGPI